MMKKERTFQNLFEMAYQPFIVNKRGPSSAKNTFETIFSALNHVDQHSLIKINPGVYEERFTITKKDLKIQASEISQNTILINREYPNIVVDLPQTSSKVILESLKLANVGQNNSINHTRQRDHETLKKHMYQSFKTHIGMNTCLYIKKGIVQLDECRISMAAYNRKDFLAPCIVVEKQGCLILNRSQVKGGQGTIGILCKGGKIVIKESMICDHGSIGLLACGSDSIVVSVKNSNFHKCNQSIVLNGPFQSFIENNCISESIETGMVVCTGNRSKIYNNEIKNGEGNGLQIRNSIPSVLKNIVTSNLGWGAKLSSSSGIICKATLKFNQFSQNNKGGIVIDGSVNVSQILNNEISYNNQFGIRVENRGSPHIFMNKVNKSLGNGIHIMDNCIGFVQKNIIDGSLKSNLVIEGPNNILNFVYENKITNARGQGIFLLHCEKFAIKNNRIQDNYNGIVSMTGVENIEGNKITNNQRNGILLIRDNNVNIEGNQVVNNKKAGLFIRDSSVGNICNNTLKSNNSELIIENSYPEFDEIEHNNRFGDGDVRIPSNYGCQLI